MPDLLFTVICEFRGGTYVSQVRAGDEQHALTAWADVLRRDRLMTETTLVSVTSTQSGLPKTRPWFSLTGMSPAYLPLFVIMGVAVDWALFEQMRTIIGTFRPGAGSVGYRDELWPRIAITIIASLIVAIGSVPEVPNALLIIVGGGMFFASSFYGDCKIWRHGGGNDA